MDQIRNLIVIGASAGGIKAISKIVNGLPETIDAAIMVVLHLSRKSSPENIVQIFQRNTNLKCLVAKDETEIEKGNIYIAPPEHHLMVNSQTINLNQGLKKTGIARLLMCYFVLQQSILDTRQ